MKKTSVIAINLKRLRPAFTAGTFAAVVLVTIFLSRSLPPVTLNSDTLRWILSSSTAFKPGLIPLAATFSLEEKRAPSFGEKKNSLPADTEQSAPAGQLKTPAVTNINPKVEISNSTDLDINADEFLSPAPSFLDKNFSVLIVHTHTTESYTPSEKYNYTPGDTDRTTDKNYNMVRVGNEIEKILSAQGIKVYHDTSMNDYPSYSGSYNRSAKDIENHIKNDSSIKIVLDVHRDAIEGKNGEKIKHTATVEGKTVAKVMFVVGSNLSGLAHDNWKENMRFAAQLQKHTESLYPSLCRPINFRSQRFNQQLAPGGIIVEVGTNGNTLDEAIAGAQYFAIALADFINSN